jgi:ligand-binding sensor domain-containing protein
LSFAVFAFMEVSKVVPIVKQYSINVYFHLLYMRIFISFTLFLLCISCFAQKQNIVLHFEHINLNNGLSNNHVNHIFKDVDGFMWFGTEDGLNRYDGSAIKIYRHINGDSTSIVGDDIFQIIGDGNKNLWVSSHCKGLNLFNRYSGKSKVFKADITNQKSLENDCDIEVVYRDKGLTWIKQKNTISLFHEDTKTFSRVYRVPNDSSTIYKAIYRDGAIWMTLNKSVAAYNIASKKVNYYSSIYSNTNKIASTEVIQLNDEFVFNWKYGEELYLFNTKKNQRNVLIKKCGIYVAKILELNKQKQIWVSTNKGLFIADLPNDISNLNENSFAQYLPNSNDANSISAKEINEIYQDDKGIIWLATNNGIDKLNPSYLNLQPQPLFSKIVKEEFLNNPPKEILLEKDENGNDVYWISYWHGPGLFKVDKNFNVVKRIYFKHPDLVYRKQDKGIIISNVLRYGKDTLCIASWDGIWLYNDKKDKLLKNYKLNDAESCQSKTTKVDFAIKDNVGKIWIGTYGQDLHCLNIQTGEWKHYSMGKTSNYTKYIRTDFMLLDSKNRLWLDEVSYYSFTDKKFVHLRFDGTANHILEDSKGNIWLATMNGLAKFIEADQTFKMYTTADGLKTNQVFRLAEDDDGNIWATSAFGLICLNTQTNIVRTFTTADGLPSNNTGQTLLKLSSGSLLYKLSDDNGIGNKPFMIFNPKELLLTVKEIPFHFTGISILNKEKIFESSLDSLQEIHISYKENLFNIQFKALEFGNNINIRYRYKINISNGWVELATQDNITFTNLRGGKYTLQVQATNASGNWMDKTLQLVIIVHPPFWQTSWFVLILLLLGAAVAIYFIRKRINSIKAKSLIKQQLTELEMKALKAQMNPHFLFNSLSSIQESIVHGKTEAASKYLGKFSKLIRMILVQSDTKTILLQDELDYLNLYLELESFRFDNFNYQITINAVSDISFIRIPSMLIQPYVENAIKHGLAHKEGNKILLLQFEDAENNLLKVIIEDNGIGVEQSTIINKNRDASHTSMGMKITEDRLLLLKYKNASTIIEDLVNETGEVIGTRVILLIPIENN